MKCPPLPGMAGRSLGASALAVCLLILALCSGPPAMAAPAAAAQAASSSPPAKKKPSTRPSKAPSKKTAAANKKTGKAPSSSHRKNRPARAAAAEPPAAAASTAAESPTEERSTAGLRLPLMLRTAAGQVDNAVALQARLETLLATQAGGSRGAELNEVRQLGPDIYAFSLQCADAQQCQQLRMAIENQREWVAGLQLDERRRIPKSPSRNSPAAR